VKELLNRWTMTVSHDNFGWSCGGVPAPIRQIHAETVALVMAESSGFALLYPVGTTLQDAVIEIALAWMTNRSRREGLCQGTYLLYVSSCLACRLDVPSSQFSVLNQLANDYVRSVASALHI
jgi:hypothetical protein